MRAKTHLVNVTFPHGKTIACGTITYTPIERKLNAIEGMEFVSDAQVLREYNRWEAELAKRYCVNLKELKD